MNKIISGLSMPLCLHTRVYLVFRSSSRRGSECRFPKKQKKSLKAATGESLRRPFLKEADSRLFILWREDHWLVIFVISKCLAP